MKSNKPFKNKKKKHKISVSISKHNHNKLNEYLINKSKFIDWLLEQYFATGGLNG